MLVAPLALATPSASRHRRASAQQVRHPASRARNNTRVAWALILVSVWLVIGMAGLIAVPAARGSASLGATLPFWLVFAPLFDLAWLKRADIANALRGRSRSARARMAAAHAATPRRHWRR